MDTNFARFHFEVLRAGERVAEHFTDTPPALSPSAPRVAPRARTWRLALANVLHRTAARLEAPTARPA